MPEHMHRREFIQTSAAAAAGLITAAGPPVAARAAAWTTLDAQVHAYERNHPGRPWAGTLVGPEEMTGDQMVAAMDAVGVDGAVLVSPFSMYRYDPSYVLEVEAKHPDRFCLVKPVDPNEPAVADIIADWKTKKGTVGVRVIMRDNVSIDPADPGVNRVLAAAAKHSLRSGIADWCWCSTIASTSSRLPPPSPWPSSGVRQTSTSWQRAASR
jgi:L-fuconolactonase